jgi:hypothetical protein
MKLFLTGFAIILVALAAGLLLQNRYVMIAGVLVGGAVQLSAFYFAWLDMKMLDLKHRGVLEFYEGRKKLGIKD